MIRKDFIERKLDLIQEELEKLKQLSGYTIDQIAADFLKQNTLERLLEKIIIRAVDINNHLISELGGPGLKSPRDYYETFLRLVDLGVYNNEFALRVAKSVGTRNKLVHEYDELIDYSQVYDSIDDCLHDYAQYCQHILDFIAKTTSSSS